MPVIGRPGISIPATGTYYPHPMVPRRTNEVLNPSAEVDAANVGPNGVATITRDSAWGMEATGGGWSFKVVTGGVNTYDGIYWQAGLNGIPTHPGEPWIASAYVRFGSAPAAGTQLSMGMGTVDAAGTWLGAVGNMEGVVQPVVNRPTRISAYGVPNPTAAYIYPYIIAYKMVAGTPTISATTFWVDWCLVERGTKLGAYFDGSKVGAWWEGTAHASASGVISTPEENDPPNLMLNPSIAQNTHGWRFDGAIATLSRIAAPAGSGTGKSSDPIRPGASDLYFGNYANGSSVSAGAFIGGPTDPAGTGNGYGPLRLQSGKAYSASIWVASMSNITINGGYLKTDGNWCSGYPAPLSVPAGGYALYKWENLVAPGDAAGWTFDFRQGGAAGPINVSWDGAMLAEGATVGAYNDGGLAESYTHRNLILDPKMEAASTAQFTTLRGTETLSKIVSSEVQYGTKFLRCTMPGAQDTEGFYIPSWGCIQGQPYTVTARVRGPAGQNMNFRMWDSAVTDKQWVPTGDWEIIKTTRVPPDNGMFCSLFSASPVAGNIDLDWWIAEQSPNGSGFYFDGDTERGAWDGGPDNSSSHLRTPGMFWYDTGSQTTGARVEAKFPLSGNSFTDGRVALNRTHASLEMGDGLARTAYVFEQPLTDDFNRADDPYPVAGWTGYASGSDVNLTGRQLVPASGTWGYIGYNTPQTVPCVSIFRLSAVPAWIDHYLDLHVEGPVDLTSKGTLEAGITGGVGAVSALSTRTTAGTGVCDIYDNNTAHWPAASPGASWTYSAWVRPTTTQTMYVSLNWRDAGYAYIANTDSVPVSVPANTWTKLTVTGAGPVGTGHVVPIIYSSCAQGQGFYADDQYLSLTTDNWNYLYNPSYEYGTGSYVNDAGTVAASGAQLHGDARQTLRLYGYGTPGPTDRDSAFQLAQPLVTGDRVALSYDGTLLTFWTQKPQEKWVKGGRITASKRGPESFGKLYAGIWLSLAAGAGAAADDFTFGQF